MFHNYLKIGSLVWIWRLFFACLLILAGALFLYFKIVPTGEISYSRAWPRGLSTGQGFVYEFRPGERLDNQDVKRLIMIGDPLYFSVFTPRSFERAEINIFYQDTLSAAIPIIEVGVLKNKHTGSYELKPIDNQIINDRLATWTSLLATDKDEDIGANILILQAENQYSSRADFLKDLNRGSLRGCAGDIRSCLAFYHYIPSFDLSALNQFNSQAQLKPLVGEMLLRGPHQFYVYFPAGDWNLEFEFAALQEGHIMSSAGVKVWARGQIIAEAGALNDDKKISLSGNAKEAGIFKVDINIDEQTLITAWQSSSDRLVFINKLWPVAGATQQSLFTDAAYLQVKAYEAESLGGLTFAGEEFLVDESYRQFNFLAGENQAANDGMNREIILSKDNLILETKGVFALRADSLFNPDFKTVDRFSAADSGIKYIMADYVAPVFLQGSKEPFAKLKSARAGFNLQDAWREDGHYTFLISVPGLGADTPGSNLEIVKIEIDLFGRTLGDKLRELRTRGVDFLLNKFTS